MKRFHKRGGQSVPSENKADKAGEEEEKEAEEKADLTALQAALTDLEEKIAKLNEESKKDSYKTLVTETQKMVENHEVTQEKADKQLELVKTAIKEVEEAIKKEAEQPKEENPTPKKRGRRGAETPAPKEEPKVLPTYTNGAGDTGTYALAEEMRKIVTYMRKNGAEESEIASIKANYDKLNEKLGLAGEDGKLSDADFAIATANLTAARDTIEAFLNNQPSNGQPTVPGTVRSVGDESSRTERAAGQDRDSSWPNYNSAKTWFIEDGSKHSIYSKYTYAWFSDQRKDTPDSRSYLVKGNADSYITEKVTKIKNGYYWEIDINKGNANGDKHAFLDNTYWFTIPKGHTIRTDSIAISRNNTNAVNAPDNQITTALDKIGIREVRKGTVNSTGQRIFTNNVYKKGNLDALVRQDRFYNRTNWQDVPEPSDVQTITNKKYELLKSNTQDLYSFTIDNNTSYKLTFVTDNTSTKSEKDLIYGSGVIAERSSSGAKHRLNTFLIHARTPAESSLGDKYPIEEKGNNLWKVNQGEYSAINFGGSGGNFGYIGQPNVYEENYAENNPERARGVIVTGDFRSVKKIDTTSYFAPANGLTIDQYKRRINDENGRPVDHLWEQDGREIAADNVASDIANTPGVKKYSVTRAFTDGTSDKIDINFVVKPKTPTITTDLTRVAGVASNIQVSGGTKGYDIYLYKKDNSGNLITLLDGNGEPIKATAGENGVATFNNLTLEIGTYVAKTVVKGGWIDYDNTPRTEVASDPSAEKSATDGAPPVVQFVGTTTPLPETRTGDALYEVIQGSPFRPMLEAWDNLGTITKFTIDNLPPGVTARNANNNFATSNNYSKNNTFGPVFFTGDVPANREPGIYTSTITVSDGVTGDKNYYLKYKVLPVAPTVTTEAKYNRTLVSTDRSISGTGVAGATITVTLQDGTTGTTTVNNQGKWTYNLKPNEKLTQNTKQDASIKANSAISIKQTKNDAESVATTVDVQLARSISIDTPVQAGRELTVKVPHDAGQFYIQVNYGTSQEYEYGVKQVDGQWRITDTNKANTTELIVKDGANASEKVLTLRIKDSNKKTNIPFTIPAGENKVRFRVHYVNSQNNPANPGNDADQGWTIASAATNTNPTITVKAPDTHNYTADGSLTMAGLKNLVTVADTEDDANKTVGNTASDNFNITIRKGNQNVTLSGNEYLKKGEYTLTYTTTDAAGVRVEKTHTITVSSLAESKGASITYPVDTAKVVYGNSDVTNGNFTPTIKQSFANKLTEVNRNNSNLPTGVTFTPGATNDKAKVVVATFPDGSTVDISHDKVAKPAAPVITPSANFDGDLGSTERSISGTGIAGATVKVALQDGKTGETTVGSDGRWTYNLKAGETLKQNYKQDATTKATSPVSVKQVANGIESAATTANVRLSNVASFDTPLQAGRDITVRVPHDAAKFYIQIAGKTGRYEYGLTKTASGWQLTEPNGATTTEVTEEAGANASEKVVKLHIKDSNQKTNVPFILPSAPRAMMVRVHYDNSAGNTASGWIFAPDATNTNPGITVKAPDTHNYTADGSLTMAGLKNLVTVADTEDDANKTVGNTASDNLNVTIRKGNQNVTLSGDEYLKKGEYTLTYTTTDAAGARVERTHNITVSSLAESKGASITYPVDTAKVVYGNSDVTNGNFTPTIKQSFADKVTEVNRGNSNLPTGVTFTPGTTNDRAKVVVATFPDGSTLDISHDKVAKPAAPTITPSNGFGSELSSTERSISGTGIAGATVKIALQDGKTGEATVDQNGNWTYNLKANEVLTQNVRQDSNTKSTNPVSVTQVMYDVESAAARSNVQLSNAASIDTPLQAGRDITVHVPHDTGKFYVVIASKEGHSFQYGFLKTDNGWQVEESVNNRPSGKTTTELTEEATSNPSERVFKLHIKDSNQKSDIPFTISSAPRAMMVRVHYDNSAGNIASGWIFAPNATNTNPTITVKAPDTHNYTADGSLTMAGLKGLVTVADTEDDANKTVGRTANENLSVTIRKGTQNVTLSGNEYLKKGDYTLTYTTTDAAGATVTKEHTITVSSIPEVSIKAAKDATAQGIVPTTESNKVINSVTIPSDQPQPISKVLKDNGRITEVDGEKVATVVLTYSDNSTKEVTVPVLEVKPVDITTTFNELDNTVTIKPNTTVETGDKLHVAIRGVGMQLIKTADGYTNSRNDRNITVNQDGSITVTLSGEEKFQAGDRVVTRHESNKNGQVDSYETEAFAGLKPVEKVPVINLTNLTPKEKEDVKAAVKKANPSVNVAELQVAANGDVTYTHRGAGVAADAAAPVVRLSETVRPANNAERYTPTGQNQTVNNGDAPTAQGSISNVADLPANTRFEWKETPTTTEKGNHAAVVVVTYPDGTSEEVPVTITVKEQQDTYTPTGQNQTVNNGDAPTAQGSISNVADLPANTRFEWKETPTTTEKGNHAAVVVVTYPDGTSEEVPVTITVKETNLNGEPEVQPETPEYTGPISSNGVDGNGNLIDPPRVDIPEFNGGANGELPDPVELPKVQLIITKWTDEQGNELKPADAKAPAVLGEANEALEAGEIEGYVFVRTEDKGDVVTHIFRKVTSTKPEGNGEQQGGDNKPQPTPEVPTDNTERKPEVVTPDEQPAETENTTTKPEASQNLLPNTGTAKGVGIFSAAAASILAGLGLIIPVKKEDEEEEETQSN